HRMKIESDSAEIISGIRFQKSLGSPISLLIKNKDWENWKDVMLADEQKKGIDIVSVPRPGHADLVGLTKFNFNDIRNSIERSSARETAARVAAGSVARKLLEEFNISIGSYVESIGGEYPENKIFEDLVGNNLPRNFSAEDLSLEADKSDVRVMEKNHEVRIINKIKQVKKKGDTLGGTFVVVATGVPVGLGSFMQYDLKLDAEIASAVMSINAVKAVSIGTGFESAEKTGSESHDEIIKKRDKLTRKTNRAGGIEGGVSNGMPVIVRAAMKPIATLMSPIESIDLKTMKKVDARRERSDFVAVPACAVIAESMLALVLAKHFLIKFGGDSIEETRDNYNSYSRKLFSRIKRNFK
ncbi:MAG TPA: chorismate synthase, partial [Ignavibacteriaceae bacterium]|nr:chorismate synthase [Ignavibacteriaceae bacterium]